MTLKVGIIRDDRYLEHKPGHTHPEHPNRIKTIYKMLDRDFTDGLIAMKPEPATLEHLELVHSAPYINKVMKTAEYNSTSLAPDTPTSAGTYLAAWLAVGGCLKGLEALVSGKCDVCLSLVRPPGHHALPDRAGGFCIFNNLGITARNALKQYGMRRVLIIDFDVHHGNGLNDLFYGENEVLYISSHDMLLYPYTGEWEEAGSADGEGYTINLPLPRELEDEEFLFLYKEVVGPLVRRFRPQLILVAAGFDAHHEDPVGRSRLTEKAFGCLTRLFLDLRAEIESPPMLFVLEGGYHPRSLARCVKEVLLAFTGPDHISDLPTKGTARVSEMVKKARRIHAGYGVWTDL